MLMVRRPWNEVYPLANYAKLEFNTGTNTLEIRIAICLDWSAVVLVCAQWIGDSILIDAIHWVP